MPAGQVRPRPSQVPQALRQPRTDVPVDVWLGATLATGRTAPTSRPYPHICGRRYGRARLGHRDCAACADKTKTPDSTEEAQEHR